MYYEINFPDAGEETIQFFRYQSACDYLNECGFNGVEALRDAIDDSNRGTRQGFAEYMNDSFNRVYVWVN